MMPIPAELRLLPHWVGWRHQRRDGRMTKIPYVLGENGRKARANDPTTWRGFDAAEAFGPQYDGIGFELLKGGGFSAVDLDLCRDRQTGAIAAWAREIVRRFNSYTEITPSQEGLRIFCRGTLADGEGWRNKRLGAARPDGHTAGCEVYSDGKYLTVTGQHLDGTPETVNDAQAALDWLQANPPTLKVNPTLTAHTVTEGRLTDEELVKKACASAHGDEFARLWAGDTSMHGGDDSRADAALCSRLAFWTDGDAARMERLFRKSALYRPKWEERRNAAGDTYGDITLRKALALHLAHAPQAGVAGTVSPPRTSVAALPDVFTADELQAMRLAPPDHPVPGLIQKGLMILGGKPKVGKSWFILNVCIAVASGGVALGKIEVTSGDVLYLALEDTQRRLQDRMQRVLGDRPWPPRLTLAIRWPRMDDAAWLERMVAWLEAHPGRRMVVVDTLQKFRPPRGKGGNLYEEDYAHLTPLKELADAYGVALVVVHHLRKLNDGSDPVDMISGTAGTAGAADGHLILKRIAKTKATLFVQGRDVVESEKALEWAADIGSWSISGDADEVKLTVERQDTLALIREAKKPLTPSDVADLLGIPRNTAKQRLYQMERAGLLTALKDGTYYEPALTDLTAEIPLTALTGLTGEGGGLTMAVVKNVEPVSPVSGYLGGSGGVIHLRCTTCSAWLMGTEQQGGACRKCREADEEAF